MARLGEYQASPLALVICQRRRCGRNPSLDTFSSVRLGRSGADARFIPAAIVARPWDFDLPPGSKPPKPVKKQIAPVLKLHRGATE